MVYARGGADIHIIMMPSLQAVTLWGGSIHVAVELVTYAELAPMACSGGTVVAIQNRLLGRTLKAGCALWTMTAGACKGRLLVQGSRVVCRL